MTHLSNSTVSRLVDRLSRPAFEFEPNRYIVLKTKDVRAHLDSDSIHALLSLCRDISRGRKGEGKDPLENCLVLEPDWPEHAPALVALRARIVGEQDPNSEAAIRAKIVAELRSSAFLHCDVNKEHVLLCIKHGTTLIEALKREQQCPFERCQVQVTHCDGQCHGVDPFGRPLDEPLAPMISVPIELLRAAVNPNAGFIRSGNEAPRGGESTRCTGCGAFDGTGWHAELDHKPDCPLTAQWAAIAKLQEMLK